MGEGLFMVNIKKSIIIIGLAMALMLGGCGDGTGPGDSSPPGNTEAPAEIGGESAEETPTVAPTESAAEETPEPVEEEEQGEDEDMVENITINAQSSIRIQDGDRVIYADPFRITDEAHDADYVLITHEHYDHFSPEDIEKVAKPETILVVPGTMMGKAKEVARSVGDIRMVKPDESGDIAGLTYETIPAYNVNKDYHPKSAGWVSYILTIGGKRIYIAGDTDMNPDNEKVECDIALVPIGGTFTMDAKEAAKLINKIQPEVAIPVHYGSVVGSKSDADTFAKKVKEPVKVEIKVR